VVEMHCQEVQSGVVTAKVVGSNPAALFLLWLFTLHINLKRVCRRHRLQYQDGQKALASVNKIGPWASNGDKEQLTSGCCGGKCQ